MEVAGIQAARWVLGKALGLVSSGALEAWAASTELGPNIRALRMELLYAQGMLNKARGRGRDQEMQNPALAELLQELRDLGYSADDVLDELDYFRIQDELDGTYHAADEHEGGGFRNCANNAWHTARAIAKTLTGFSNCCSSGGDSHNNDEGKICGACRCVVWPCLGLTPPTDDEEDEEEEEDASQRDRASCGGLWPRRRAAANQLGDQEPDKGCMERLASGTRNTIHAVGKHFPCYSASSSVQISAEKSTTASSERHPTAKLKFDRVEISQKMKEIVEQLKPVCAKVSTILNLELLDSNRSVAQWIATSLDGRVSNKQWHTPIQKFAKSRPITTSELIEPQFYGRKDKTSNIIHEITKGKYCDKTLTVLPIVGPGGIGKTTLTQYIYNDAEVQKYFEVKLWVCVSINFNMYRLKQEIADQLSKANKDIPDKLIEEKLNLKRFLLVLDDIWNCSDGDEWKRFLLPFTKGQTKGSVIIVTTRFPAVAQMVMTVDHHIDLEGLDHESFKQLFLACVFGDKETQDNHSGLLETGFMIMEKLKGSPLAAKTVGRLLKNNLDLGHWTRVLESREWEVQQGDHDIMPALKLSFDYLPFHLQQCFTYCALFPEDYKFGREELIQFWIGLEVLHSHAENISIEDIGATYLHELVNYGFLKMEEEYEPTCYVIHDLLHELALKVSANECLSIYSSRLSSTQILPYIRHLSINIDDSSVKDRMSFDDCRKDFSAFDKRFKVENLHSLMLFGEHQYSFVKSFSGLFSKAKSLRVIFISGDNNYSEVDLLPKYLMFVHLRYLRIMSGFVGLGLCNNISKCYHLRVLHLLDADRCHDLTTDMGNLRKLRHFLVGYNTYTIHSRISNVGRLTSLQALERFVLKNKSPGFELRQIGQLQELHGFLRIDNLEKVESREEAEEAKLMHKKHLHEVELNWDIDRSIKNPTKEDQVLEGLKPYGNLAKLCIRGHGGVKCPSWLGVNLSVKSLESLGLDNVAWKTFPPIGLVNEELPSDIPNHYFDHLRKIELNNLVGVRKWVVDTTCKFYSCLETLIISGCSELMELSFLNSTCGQKEKNTWFPKLRMLNITGCSKLTSLCPVPWTRVPCKIYIGGVALGFEALKYLDLSLIIVGKDDADDQFWTALDFNKLTELKSLEMIRCPPLPLDRLKMLSSIKYMSGAKNIFWILKEGRNIQFQLPIESIGIDNLDASGTELSQLLSYMPKLLTLSIRGCKKITGLGVVEQQDKVGGPKVETRVNNSRRKEEAGGGGGRAGGEEEEEKGVLLLPPHLQDLFISEIPELCILPDLVGLHGLCSLHRLRVRDCPKLVCSYLGASSSSPWCPFPISLQELDLETVELVGMGGKMASLSNLVSLTHLRIDNCGDLRGGFWHSHLPRGCLTRLTVNNTHNLFFVPEQGQRQDHSLSSPFSVLQELVTDDATGVLAAPICRLLSSSLTRLVLSGNEERFTEQQEKALQFLTALQELELRYFLKLQCLPASGLRGLPMLKSLTFYECPAIRSLRKEGLPNSLQKLEINYCRAICSLPKDGLPNSLQQLVISNCPTIRALPKAGLPNSLQKLLISNCPTIRALPKVGLPNSLQELLINYCPSIRTLPKAGLPSSLRRLNVATSSSEELKSHCRKLIGTIPIVEV